MKNIILSLLLSFTAISIMSSCKKFVEIPAPKNQLVSSTVFADSAGANAAINGIYVNMMQSFSLSFTNGGITLYTGLSGDELYESINNTSDMEFYNNAITINNSVNNSFWTAAYKYIYDANACIEGIKNSSNISGSASNSLIAEAEFIRSFLYFNLWNLYGNVPIVLGTDYSKNRTLGRGTQQELFAQMISDLKFAQANLPGNSGTHNRASNFAATSLLAKVYLYQGQYANAATESDKVINSGNYTLATDLNSVFLTGSSETIWCFTPVVPGKGTWEGYYFAPQSNTVLPRYIITDALYQSFENGDMRKTSWVGVNSVSGKIYPYPYKYKIASTVVQSPEDYVVFRLAEQILISAEAKANLGDLTDALVDVNMIRNRSNLPNFTITTKELLLKEIQKQRRIELFCEWGNRWFDLKRTNTVDTTLSGEKPNWKDYAKLFPVPQQEISANPSLTQNAGY